jgi:hypothetical protein
MREDKKYMDRNPALLYKTLVVGVIILFVGLGLQPAIAVTSQTIDNDDESVASDEYNEIITYIEGYANLDWIKRRGLLRGEVDITEWEQSGYVKILGFRYSNGNIEYFFELTHSVYVYRFIGWVNNEFFGIGNPIVFGFALGNIEWN